MHCYTLLLHGYPRDGPEIAKLGHDHLRSYPCSAVSFSAHGPRCGWQLFPQTRQGPVTATCCGGATAHLPHSAASDLQALRTSIPAQHPLLPARMRSLRSVSRILTSPPQQAKRARSGSLQLHSAQTCRRGYQSGIAGENPEPPPAPENHGPGSRFPPDPLLTSPRNDGPRRPMTVEDAKHDSSRCGGDRRRCRHEDSRRTDARQRCRKTSAHDRGRCPGAALRGSRIPRGACRTRKPASIAEDPPGKPGSGARRCI